MSKKTWLKCLAYYNYWREGYPLTQIRFFRKTYSYPIEHGRLYRRSKALVGKEHWNQTIILGELSCNWSMFCKKLQYVLLTSGFDNLYNPTQRRVLICDLDAIPTEEEKDSFPFCKTINSEAEGELRIMVCHKPDENNYSHCHIDCYLTTYDGAYQDCLIAHEDYDKYPLKKQLSGLRRKYKAHLLYHFNEHVDY